MRHHPPVAIVVVAVAAIAAAATVFACRAAQDPRGPAAVSLAPGPAASDAGAPPTVVALEGEEPTAKLVAFHGEDELRETMSAWKDEETARQRRQTYPMKAPDLDGGVPPAATATSAPQLSPPPASPAAHAARPAPARAAPGKAAESKAESITNNQHANVDEGDIVKLHGDHLVVLRRGRLFTLGLDGDRVQKSAMLDAFGPDIDPAGSWYDEMVIEGNDLAVIGFSYARGGTEVGLFRIDATGRLTYRSTYHLRSNDYYSARNYASRIVDGRLVFYAPMHVSPHEQDPLVHFPAVRRWSRGAKDTDFTRTLAPTRLYHMEGEAPGAGYAALHTVTSCDLRSASLACESVAMLGPPGRVFYVSPTNVYVWMQDGSATAGATEKRARGVLAKIPLAPGAAVTAMRVSGMPTDQFSFEEDDGGSLNVLVRSESNGDAMWASEATRGSAALLRVPLGLFSDGVPVASSRRYHAMPRPDGYSVQNRFVGPWLLYGAGQGYWTPHQGAGQLYAVRYASPTAEDEVKTISLAQGVDRIEPMGDDAVVVGGRGADLVFSPIGLGAATATARGDYVRKNASQGELRSHGFFYKPSADRPNAGIIGLPIRTEGGGGGARYLLEGSASVLFLRNEGLDLSELGALAASPVRSNHDGCRASCVDWYGNARPIFAKGRVFALMGYELVEGKVDGRRITERGRLSFAPRGGPPAGDDGD